MFLLDLPATVLYLKVARFVSDSYEIVLESIFWLVFSILNCCCLQNQIFLTNVFSIKLCMVDCAMSENLMCLTNVSTRVVCHGFVFIVCKFCEQRL